METILPFYSRKRQWSDRDHHFGIFTYSRNNSYKRIEAMLCSGGEENEGCHLRLSPWWFTLIIELPAIVPPHREKVVAGWDEDTIKRLGRDYYYDVTEREYGFQLSGDGFLQVRYGRQDPNSGTTQDWCKSLPFTQWRFVRKSHYGLSGELFFTEHNPAPWGSVLYRENEDMQAQCPSVTFRFKDYDGEKLTAKTKIEEREWHFGQGWFKWLSLFRAPLVRRSLDIEFIGVSPAEDATRSAPPGASLVSAMPANPLRGISAG